MTTSIVSRTVTVTHLDEAADLAAGYAYPEDAANVRLTADLLEEVGGQALRPGRAWACQLDLFALDADGDTDGIQLGTHGYATATFTGEGTTAIPAQTTIKKAAVATLWETGAASALVAGTKSLTVTCQAMGAIAAVAHSLDTISPAVSGLASVDNASDATPGAAYALTLLLRDQRTQSVIQERSSLVETVSGGGIYQITADTDQRSRLAEIGDGNAGRLVIRWAEDDDYPPPIGTWDFDLVVDFASGSAVVARGELEVLQ